MKQELEIKYAILLLYVSPNQFLEEFETFADNFKLNLDTIARKQPFLIVIPGDLNTKSSKSYGNYSTSYEGTKIDDITLQFGMQHLINEKLIYYLQHLLASI